MPVSIRHVQPSDYGRVIQHVNEWWGGREMAPMLPRLFFILHRCLYHLEWRLLLRRTRLGEKIRHQGLIPRIVT